MTENTMKEKMQICSPTANNDMLLNLSVWQQTHYSKFYPIEAGTRKTHLALEPSFRSFSAWERLSTFDFHIKATDC